MSYSPQGVAYAGDGLFFWSGETFLRATQQLGNGSSLDYSTVAVNRAPLAGANQSLQLDHIGDVDYLAALSLLVAPVEDRNFANPVFLGYRPDTLALTSFLVYASEQRHCPWVAVADHPVYGWLLLSSEFDNVTVVHRYAVASQQPVPPLQLRGLPTAAGLSAVQGGVVLPDQATLVLSSSDVAGRQPLYNVDLATGAVTSVTRTRAGRESEPEGVAFDYDSDLLVAVVHYRLDVEQPARISQFKQEPV